MWDNVIAIFEVLIRQFIWLMMPALHTQEILMLRKELQLLKRSSKRPMEIGKSGTHNWLPIDVADQSTTNQLCVPE
jgi:hypothetical protein